MKWNLNNEGGNASFEKGKRYELVVSSANEGESKNKGTPFIKFHFETPDMAKAYDKTLYNTEAAAYRMIEWARALGLPSDGDVEIEPDNLAGIHLTARCDYRKADDGKEYLEWVEPQPIVRGAPVKAAAKVAPKAAAKVEPPPAGNIEEVPF